MAAIELLLIYGDFRTESSHCKALRWCPQIFFNTPTSVNGFEGVKPPYAIWPLA